MSVGHSISVNTALYVSTVEVSLARDSEKTVESIRLATNNGQSLKDIQITLPAGGIYREEFDPPLVVESDGHISVLVGCRSKRKSRLDVPIDINLRDVECVREDWGIKSCRKKTRNVEVVVRYRFSGELVATTTELMDTCAKFRILIIGNVIIFNLGCGDKLKYTHSFLVRCGLIRKVFGVKEMHASKTTRGTADIDQEFVSPTNKRFVVHDSLGFEAGDKRNMEIIKEFVTRRQAMPRLEDHLHAIWLCVDTPYSGGRLAETGAEQFLRRQRDIISDVPLVVVLTKVDLLDIRLDLEMLDNGDLKSYRSRDLDEHCVRPLREAAGHDITPVAVSVEEGYSETLSDLIKTTRQNMARDGVDEAPRAMASIAQRVDMKEKLELSVAVGKQKYWKTLLKSAFFHGHTLKECLQVIRKDIITVWNFYDPDQCLMDDKLIIALLRTDNLGDPCPSTSQSTMTSFAALLASGLDLAKSLSASGEITLTVAACVAGVTIDVLRMTYDTYREAKKDVKIFMAYIVDLICVMQAIFLIAPDGPVTPETVVLVLRAYEVPRKIVHMCVEGFDGKHGVPLGRDEVLEKIETLIWRYSISDHDLEKWRQGGGDMSRSSTL